MKIWNKVQYGDTLKTVRRIEVELNSLEDASSTRQLSSQELATRKKLQEDLWSAAHAHDSLMRQKARVRWLKEGDCNSRYFHLLMNSRRITNAVKGVMINGSWVEDPTTVKEEICRFFKNRFAEPEQLRPVLNGTRFNGLGQQQNELLVTHFHEEEIRSLYGSAGGKKALDQRA